MDGDRLEVVVRTGINKQNMAILMSLAIHETNPDVLVPLLLVPTHNPSLVVIPVSLAECISGAGDPLRHPLGRLVVAGLPGPGFAGVPITGGRGALAHGAVGGVENGCDADVLSGILEVLGESREVGVVGLFFEGEVLCVNDVAVCAVARVCCESWNREGNKGRGDLKE